MRADTEVCRIERHDLSGPVPARVEVAAQLVSESEWDSKPRQLDSDRALQIEQKQALSSVPIGVRIRHHISAAGRKLGVPVAHEEILTKCRNR